MAEINNRIEEELTLSPITYLRGIDNAHNTEANAFEAGKKAQLEHNQHQISQLFPQPLDDEGLAEGIRGVLEGLLGTPPAYDKESVLVIALKQILTLLPDIEEARRQGEKDGLEKAINWLQTNYRIYSRPLHHRHIYSEVGTFLRWAKNRVQALQGES